MNILDSIDINPTINSNKYFYNGRSVPRVTEIISAMLYEEYLMKWSNSLGYKHKSYIKEVNLAANIGTQTHEIIDQLLDNKSVEIPSSGPVYYTVHSFIEWYNILKNSGLSIEIISKENQLVCSHFGGTYDLLIRINNKLWLIDFKSSNHISYKYYIQLAAYRYMLQLNNIHLDGCMLLQLDKSYIFFKEYPLIFSNPEHLNYINQCTNTFFGLVYGYYNRLYLEEQYKTLFQEK